MYGRALSLAPERIRASTSPACNSKSLNVFDSLGFRRFTSEPGEDCPSADESITKYNCFSAQSIDALPHKELLTAAWYLEYIKKIRNLTNSAPKNHQMNKQIIVKVIWIRG